MCREDKFIVSISSICLNHAVCAYSLSLERESFRIPHFLEQHEGTQIGLQIGHQ